MKKIISFCLYGEHKFYNYGAIENVLLANKYYPDWISRFYILNDVPQNIIDQLKKMNNTEVIIRKNDEKYSNMMWRFEPLFEDDVKIMMSRDCDSRITEREVEAVNEWLKSDKDFHIMRDHPNHKMPIMGGMFGARNKVCFPLKEKFLDYPRTQRGNNDQLFLKDIVYPYIKDKAFIHDMNYKPDLFPEEKDLMRKEFPNKEEINFVGSRVFDTLEASKIFGDKKRRFKKWE